jgi:hypothetical protein
VLVSAPTAEVDVLAPVTFVESISLKAFGPVLGVLFFASACSAQSIPKEIWGKWTIQRELPARTISCWAETEARKIIGTHIEYSEKIFRWDSITTNDPVAESKTVTAQQFHDENSGGSVNSSQIDFQQLGIKAARATEITIRHADAHVSPETNEIPGDDILLKDEDTIVFSVCNTYFEAKRDRSKK